MTPAQLDIFLNGAFIYGRADGSRFASVDYKLKDMGVPLVGRAGRMSDSDLQGTVEDYLARVNAEVAA